MSSSLSTNDYNLLKSLDQPLLEAFLAVVRYEAHLSYQREIHRLITESVFGSLLFDESDIDDKDAIKDVSSYFWYRDLESYFQHTATKVFPEELRKNMESWLSTEWYQEHMQETLEKAAFRLAEDWLYVVSFARFLSSPPLFVEADPSLCRFASAGQRETMPLHFER